MTDRPLKEKFGENAVIALHEALKKAGSPEVSEDYIQMEFGAKGVFCDVKGLLKDAAAAGVIIEKEVMRCPAPGCSSALNTVDVQSGCCPECSYEFALNDDSPIGTLVYKTTRGPTRSVPWLVAVHGFNTNGAWQESFSWLVAHRFKYHAPVLIYKYGILRVGVLFQLRHRVLTKKLGIQLREAINHAKKNGIEEPPDVIIHSFGSHLFSLLLKDNEFSDLKFGRIIAIGSVVRPDFDWSYYIKENRIEAIMCHCGGKDLAVPFSQLAIPNTGPAGKIGFLSPDAVNILSPYYSHSSALTDCELEQNLAEGGLWDCFLRGTDDESLRNFQFRLEAWTPLKRSYVTSLKVLAVLLASVTALIIACS